MFEDFWREYPRKEAKKDALKAWSKLTTEQQDLAASAIETHKARWNALETQKEFIPLPASWLRGWRFDDEIEMPEPRKLKQVDQAWWSSDAGMLAKGLEFNTKPRPGEGWPEFKGRLIILTRKAQ